MRCEDLCLAFFKFSATSWYMFFKASKERRFSSFPKYLTEGLNKVLRGSKASLPNIKKKGLSANKNVAAYLAGYILQKIPVDECGACSATLRVWWTVCTWVPHKKTYKEPSCLVYPTIAMVQFLENLESLLCAIFEGIVHMPFILTWLCKSADKHCQFLTCTDIKCKLRVQNMVKLYMKVCIFHALKCSNAYNTEDKSIKC